ncbi:UDP-N-acetylmuramoyl-tripeptide--D-alanyl-D-alanine ligase [bacterium]|nr:MAG: UDP-N-acetylmuramoyl-tripeptide--D-alanyl-D-alanine ligase [bacterium]
MFKVKELLAVTKGKLLKGRSDIAVKGISIDSRTIRPKEVFLAIKGDNFDGHDFIGPAIRKGASCVIMGKGVKKSIPIKGDSRALIEVRDTLRALADIATFWRNKFNIPLVAVTGSNGKTTTKEMIAWILAKKLRVLKNEGTKNNHIGLPLALCSLDSRDELAVVEIGSNHFGEIGRLSEICQPNLGVITSIGPAHLEHLINLKGVFREKYSLVENLRHPRIAILNSDNNMLRKKILKNNKKSLIFSFGIKEKADFRVSQIQDLSGELKFLVNEKYKFTLSALGYYNIYNALAAIAVARIFGMTYQEIAGRLADFVFPAGRLKIIQLGDFRFIDDTYNANPLSLKQALDALANFKTNGRRIFIMGDMMELGRHKEQFHRQAGRQIALACDTLITVGKLSGLAAGVAGTLGLSRQNIFSCEFIDQARDILFKRISPRKGDIILVKGSRAMTMERIFRF